METALGKTKDLVHQTLRIYARTRNTSFYLFARELLDNTAKFDELFDLLSDDISRAILEWVIKWRLATFLTESRDVATQLIPTRISPVSHKGMLERAKALPEGSFEGNLDVDLIENYILNGYNLDGICEASPSDIVLDLGAYNGNSSIVFGRLCESGKVFAFEPNPNVREMLGRNLAKANLKNVEIVPYGSGEKTGKIRFKKDGAASRVDPKGDIDVNVIRIDDFVRENALSNVNFMKFDVEGSEMSALRGAVDTIRFFRPKIAVSVYHLYNDLITIPFFIRDVGLWYDFYLRHNAVTGGELVLFCNPTGI